MNPSPPPPVTKIWILEDHQVFATQMCRLLSGESDMECEYCFTNADDLYEKLRTNPKKPDLLLLDVGLPRKDGIQVLTELHKVMPELKMIILTAFDDKEKVYRAICNGASGYLLKTADPDEILAGIRDVIHGASALSSPIAKMILEGFARYGPVAQVENLTTREEDVLRLLVQGFIKKEIADQLAISQHTVDMHLRSVYRKLHVRTQTEAVSKAIRQGLV